MTRSRARGGRDFGSACKGATEKLSLVCSISVCLLVVCAVAVAAAITDEHGRAVAAINVSVPTSRWTPEKAEAELAQHVQVAATSISKSKFAPYRL